MVKRYALFFLCFFLPFAAACEKNLPGYGDVVSIEEKETIWKVTLHKSRHNTEGAISVQLEYVNEKGDSFSLKPENVVLSDDKGRVWPSSGSFPYIRLLQPGNSKTVSVVFRDVPIGKQALYVHPLRQLATSDPKILLKTPAADPVPGEHADANWHQAE